VAETPGFAKYEETEMAAHSAIAPRVPSVRQNFESAIAIVARFVRSENVSRKEAEHAVEYLETRPMKVGDVQRALGVKSPTTIKKWIAAGRFPGAMLVNRQWRIPSVEVYAMRDAGQRAAELTLLGGPQPFGEYEGDPFEDLI
jgi:hypothetical protein